VSAEGQQKRGQKGEKAARWGKKKKKKIFKTKPRKRTTFPSGNALAILKGGPGYSKLKEKSRIN